MLSINMDDVMQVVSNIQNYLIAFGVVLVLALLVMFAVRKMPKAKKKMIRAQSGLAILLALAIVVNLICTGPMSTMLDLVSGEGSISEETSAEATELVNEITQEGIVLAQNDDNILPVASGSKLNVFGWASTSPCYGGTGSGALNDAYPVTDLLTGLHDAGIETNDELSKFYTDYCSTRPTVGMSKQDWTLPEPNVSLYTDEMMENAKAYSDTAMVVITRVGGEGADLPTDMSAVVDGSWIRRVAEYRGSEKGAGYYNGTYDDSLNEGNDWDKGDHFLQLSNREEELIDLVTSNFDKVVVVYNGANAFEMDWVKDYPQIKGVLLCPGTGQSGFEGFGRVVAGEVNPSGRTADTYVADLTASPWWNNFGDFKYTNASEFNSNASGFDPEGTTPSFVNYVEGIYVGYKFYETAADEGLIDYDKEVVYPFGYGLSYTTFTQKMSDITSDGSSLKFSVTVTNTGSAAGKDVVEIYNDPPYTNGGIEKASANLLDFAKTSELAPGESETIDFTIPVEDLASYDYKNNGCYVLEAGDYIISTNSDAHNVLDSKTYTVASDIVYNESNKRESDEVVAINQFDFAEGEITYLSRADGFANYDEAIAAPATYEMSDEAKAGFENCFTYTESGYEKDEDPNAEDITTGAKNGLKIEDNGKTTDLGFQLGADFNDPQWDALLDELTVDEMENMYINAYGGLAELKSVGKTKSKDADGPSQIGGFTGMGAGTGFPSSSTLAQTWNGELAQEEGRTIGTQALQNGYTGWYAPATNMHRSPFNGRNYEYYSEDSLLSGVICGNTVHGANDAGVYTYVKHFICNDGESGIYRDSVYTWMTEQALREIYLRPFQMLVEDYDAVGLMSSYNRIGAVWAGGSEALLTGILRDEWGFDGAVITDYCDHHSYMNGDQALRAGGSLWMAGFIGGKMAFETGSNSYLQALRRATKEALYMYLHVRVTNRDYAESIGDTAALRHDFKPAVLGWRHLVALIDLVAVALFALAIRGIVRDVKLYKAAKAARAENKNA